MSCSHIRVIGLLVLTFAQGCSTKEVKDFASWCQYIHDPKIGQYDVFRMDKQAVIDGVVAAWDRIIVENSAQALGSPANIDSEVTYCLYSGISVFFARLDIHASDGTAAVTNATFEKLKRYN